jgi:hypothetical protein
LSRSDKILLQADQHCSKLLEKDQLPSSGGKEENVDNEIFETSIISFLDSLNLQDENLDDIQLLDVRKKMEQVQGREFTPQERRIFIAVVKKYVMSLQYPKPHNTKSHKFSQNIKTDVCTKQELVKQKQVTNVAGPPPHMPSAKKGQMPEKRYDEKSGNVTSWISTRVDYPAEVMEISSPVGKSSSERRNLISLEDSDCAHKSTTSAGDDGFEEERGHGRLNDRALLKRKSSQSDGTNKRFPALSGSNLNTTDSCYDTDLQEKGSTSEQSTGEDLIQCPVCKGGFTLLVSVFFLSVYYSVSNRNEYQK